MQKRKRVVVEVLKGLALSMLLLNIIGIGILATYSKSKMVTAQENYVAEIVSNISNSAEMKVAEFLTATEVMATSTEIIAILEECSPSSPMTQSARVENVIRELSANKSQFGSSVSLVALISASENAFITDSGDISSPSDNVSAQPYYGSVLSGQTMITEPYFDSFSNTTLVSISCPVRSSSGSEILGCIVVDLSISFLSELISDFGDTGTTWVIDTHDDILAHTDSSLIGQSYTSSGVTGEDFTREVANPTGTFINYERNGVTRVGSVGNMSSLGWRLVAGMDETEYLEDSTFVVLFIVVIQGLVVLLALTVSGVSIYMKLRPIKELNSSMLEMSKGNLAFLPTFRSDDEIGELCDNLRTTMSNLDIYIKEIQANLDAFGNGDFTRQNQLVFLGDFLAIQTSTESFKALIGNTLASLQSSVEQVSVGSDQVASGSQNLAEGSSRQSASVSELHEFIQTITKQIQDNSQNVEEVNLTAQRISDELASNNTQMDAMAEAMNDIQEKSDGITKIVKTIEDVAFQTNILALNAAVEAARAGSSGRGFAVVAEEVRNLSARTSEAVQNTTSLIGDSTASVQKGHQIASATIENLKSVTEDIRGFIDALDTIATASGAQAEAISKINAGVDEIANVMQTNSAVSEESAATSEELSSQATMMLDEIQQFKLK